MPRGSRAACGWPAWSARRWSSNRASHVGSSSKRTRLARRRAGQQHAGLLEALPDGRDPGGAARRSATPELRGGLGVGEAGAARRRAPGRGRRRRPRRPGTRARCRTRCCGCRRSMNTSSGSVGVVAVAHEHHRGAVARRDGGGHRVSPGRSGGSSQPSTSHTSSVGRAAAAVAGPIDHLANSPPRARIRRSTTPRTTARRGREQQEDGEQVGDEPGGDHQRAGEQHEARRRRSRPRAPSLRGRCACRRWSTLEAGELGEPGAERR